jgi:hypothetical protein
MPLAGGLLGMLTDLKDRAVAVAPEATLQSITNIVWACGRLLLYCDNLLDAYFKVTDCSAWYVSSYLSGQKDVLGVVSQRCHLGLRAFTFYDSGFKCNVNTVR